MSVGVAPSRTLGRFVCPLAAAGSPASARCWSYSAWCSHRAALLGCRVRRPRRRRNPWRPSSGEPLGAATRPPVLDDEILPLDQAIRAETLSEWLQSLAAGIAGGRLAQVAKSGRP